MILLKNTFTQNISNRNTIKCIFDFQFSGFTSMILSKTNQMALMKIFNS